MQTINKVIHTKNDIRKLALKKRQALYNSRDLIINSKKIVDKIKSSSLYRNAKNIALYYPIKNEVDLRELLSDSSKKFYLPRCVNNEIEFAQYSGVDSLKIGSYNILEPINETVNPYILDLIFIPALAANTKRYRIGYGKGYYDRFFHKFNIQAKKIIVIQSSFLTDEFSAESHDVQADFLLTEV